MNDEQQTMLRSKTNFKGRSPAGPAYSMKSVGNACGENAKKRSFAHPATP